MNRSTCTFEFYWHKLPITQLITEIFLNLLILFYMYFFGWSVVVVPELVSLAVVCGPAPCIVRVVMSGSP